MKSDEKGFKWKKRENFVRQSNSPDLSMLQEEVVSFSHNLERILPYKFRCYVIK